MSKEREKWIDYTKVFACILVVIGHLLQGLNKSGIEWNNTLYEYLDKFIYLFHMPLFMCLSGYLYKKTTDIKTYKDYGKFAYKKLLNLGIPYVFFYILYLCINLIFSNDVNTAMGKNEFLNILTKPIAPYWFLYILLIIFLIIPLIEKLLKKNTKLVFILTLAINIYNIIFPIQIYVLNMLAQYMFYFYLGSIIQQRVQQKSTKNINSKISLKLIIVNMLIYIGLLIVYFNIKFGNNYVIELLIKLLMAIYGIIICLYIFRTVDLSKSKYWESISKYTFQIYLMHTIFTAATRILLLKLSITNFYIHFVLGLTIGIIGPIIIGIILNKIKYGNIILFPVKTIKEIRKNENCNDRT